MSRNNHSRLSRHLHWKESSSFCSFLKVVVFLVGIVNLFLVFLINSWQSSEPAQFSYIRTPITIEERRTYSDLINYAADFNGAEIMKTHQVRTSIYEFFFNDENPPEFLLSPDNSKGKCWGFEGQKGFVQIRTLRNVYPQHFTFRHCNLVNFDSAPREVCAYRVDKNDENQAILGCYEFILSKARPDPEFVQTFPCLNNCEKPGQIFKFEVFSNHGAEATCVYQIEIHGEPVQLA